MRRLTALTALALTVALVGGPAPSLAGDISAAETMAIDPTEGPPGTVITVTGEGCSTKGNLEVDVQLYDTEDVEQDSALVEPSTDGFGGEWEATLMVPADTTDYGDWTVDAVCQFAQDEVALGGFGRSVGGRFAIDYDDRIFEVTQPALTTTNPSTTTTTTPRTGGSAPAAVVAAPTFTG